MNNFVKRQLLSLVIVSAIFAVSIAVSAFTGYPLDQTIQGILVGFVSVIAADIILDNR